MLFCCCANAAGLFSRVRRSTKDLVQIRCFPMSGLQPASMHDGMERYAHCQGEVMFRRRAPMQVAATLGQKRTKQGDLRYRLGVKGQAVRHLRARPFGLNVCRVLLPRLRSWATRWRFLKRPQAQRTRRYQVAGKKCEYRGACLWGLLSVAVSFQRPREILVWGRQPNNNKVLEARELALCHVKA